MAAYRRVDDLRSPVGWLPVHRDQLRAQCSVMSMGKPLPLPSFLSSRQSASTHTVSWLVFNGGFNNSQWNSMIQHTWHQCTMLSAGTTFSCQRTAHRQIYTHHMYVHSLCLQLDTRTLLFTWLSSLQPSEPGRPCLLKNLCGTGARCQPTNVVKALKELQALTAIILRPACVQLVAWHNGITLVFGRRTFLVLRSTCSWRVTTYG